MHKLPVLLPRGLDVLIPQRRRRHAQLPQALPDRVPGEARRDVVQGRAVPQGVEGADRLEVKVLQVVVEVVLAARDSLQLERPDVVRLDHDVLVEPDRGGDDGADELEGPALGEGPRECLEGPPQALG